MGPVKSGTTNVSVIIRIIDSTDGTPETAVEHNTAGIDLWYRREVDPGGTPLAKVSITEAALAALTTAHTDGGIEHIGDGYYRLDVADAAFATGAIGVMIGGTVTGMVVIGTYVPLVDYDPQDTVRLGLTALPNAVPDTSGGLPTEDASGHIAVDVAEWVGNAVTFGTGGPDVNVNAISDDTTAATNAESFFDGTGYAGTGNVIPTVTTVSNGVSLAAGAITDASLAGNMEIVFETDFATNYNTTRNAWATNVQDTVGTGTLGLNDISTAEVNTEVDTALADIGLDHLISSALPTNWATDVAANSVFDQIADDGTAAYDRTTDSLQAIADSGGGGPTAAQIADAVWDEAQADHVAAGSFGLVASEVADILVDTAEIGAAGAGLTAVPWNAAWDAEVQSEVTDALNAYDPPTRAELTSDINGLNDPTAAAIADAVWDEAQADHVAAGSFGLVASEVADILVDTAEIGAAGAGLTAVPWNAAWDAEVQSECTDALNAYDPPTNTEMEARTLTAAGIAQLQQNLDNCFAGTASGTPTTTTMVSNIGVTANDQFNGRIITFDDDTSTAALQGQSTDITGCTAATNTLTFTALTTAPASGDTFVIT